MNKETLRMQMLAGVITEEEYKSLINEDQSDMPTSNYKKFMHIYNFIKSHGESTNNVDYKEFKGIKAGLSDGGMIRVIKNDDYVIILGYHNDIKYIRGEEDGLDKILNIIQ